MIANDLKFWEHRARAVNDACLSATRGDVAASGAAADASALRGAGLVPSKTSLKTVSFAPSVVAERRVNRLKKSVWASGHLHGMGDAGFRNPSVWFVTLTYAKANAWTPKHMSAAVQGFRNWCNGRGYPCRYTWVAEIQPGRFMSTGQAVVHYHMLAWLPAGVRMPQWDRPTRTPSGKQKSAWWPHGMSNTEKAKAGVGYLMKYLSKLGEQSRFPKGLRLYGIGGLSTQGRAVRSWYNLPEWVKRSYGVGEIGRLSKGFFVKHTGEILEPMYSVKKIPFGIVITALRDIADRFHDGAYSTFPRAFA